ncbi:UDP-glycosyltransferase 83A1 [Heracleum sosnowskyi]|uniref:UDP-glycosyltransferase 83A1 n=1 Tax=Heracleum sosnowskyi TaxID=360622 RepID=A0AAD8HC05_9APIA|nr:UDP-glycosyltransferase 83A1 [Heracleum sosnowskyi]
MDLQQHALVVPCPAQGHVTPLIKMAYNLASHGIKVTFANSEFIEAKILAAMSDEDKKQCPLRLVSYSDGLESHPEQRNGLGLIDCLKKVMPDNLEKLIKQINHSDNKEPITCVIADLAVGWTLEVASKMGLKKVAVWPAGPACLALPFHIPKLIETGVIDENGSPIGNELICLAEELPLWNSSELIWSSPANLTAQKFLFDCSLSVKQAAENASIVLCNTYYELDSFSCAMIPNILPIGPLPAIKNLNPSSGTFSSQDSTCLSWLDKQPSNSVIYVAFGSTTVFSQKQFNELALGLELSGQSFLWVVRSNIVNGSFPEYPNDFLERTTGRGKIVEWAPQEEILAHTSVSCFFSHCGWNSTMEGLSHGVPFLCWPYMWDQFYNKKYICDVWKIGLSLEYDEDGMISRHEIKTKIDNLFSGDGFKTNALKLMEDAKKSVNEGGSSYENFESLIKYLKA